MLKVSLEVFLENLSIHYGSQPRPSHPHPWTFHKGPSMPLEPHFLARRTLTLRNSFTSSRFLVCANIPAKMFRWQVVGNLPLEEKRPVVANGVRLTFPSWTTYKWCSWNENRTRLKQSCCGAESRLASIWPLEKRGCCCGNV